MSGDKRSVSTDALETLGTIIDEKAGRDAIHIAVEPVIAAHPLRPGDHVGLLGDGKAGICDKPLGIVDPFLKAPVMTDQRFWLLVYPRQITSLRHVWVHPAFGDAKTPVINPSETWLKQFAYSMGVGYEELLFHAKAHAETGDYWVEGGRFEGMALYGESEKEFWKHYEAATGEKVDEENRGNFFSCSC